MLSRILQFPSECGCLIWLWPLLAFLLGLWLAWLTWGRYRRLATLAEKTARPPQGGARRPQEETPDRPGQSLGGSACGRRAGGGGI